MDLPYFKSCLVISNAYFFFFTDYKSMVLKAEEERGKIAQRKRKRSYLAPVHSDLLQKQ